MKDKKIRIYAISKYQILATDDKGHWYRAKENLNNISLNDMVSSKGFYKLDQIESESYELAKRFQEYFKKYPSLF